MKWSSLSCLVTLVSLVTSRAQGNVFDSDPNIYEVSTLSFDRVVHQSNYTALVVFYAPWCGYCQQLKPTIQKVAKRLHQNGQYAAKVVTVNCDEDKNKQLCGEHQVQGFPTVMVFRPPKYSEGAAPKARPRHASEVYNGERTAKAMISFMLGRIKNYVKRFSGWDTVGDWIGEDGKRVILVSSKSQLSPLLKTLAIDFADALKFALVVVKEGDTTATISVNSTEVIVPAGKLPVLAFYSADKGQFETFSSSTKDKKKISEWLVEVTGTKPREGPLSKRDQKIAKYRSGKKTPMKDEL